MPRSARTSSISPPTLQASTNTGQFVAAIDIAAFVDPDEFGRVAAKVFDEMRASEPLPGHAPVRLAGEGKSASVAEARERGLSLAPALVRDLEALATEYGIETPFG